MVPYGFGYRCQLPLPWCPVGCHWIAGSLVLIAVIFGNALTACIHHSNSKFNYLGGISVGGGTLQGLSKYLISTENAKDIEELAKKGDRKELDFLIGDVVNEVDNLEFKSSEQKHELSALYEEKIKILVDSGRAYYAFDSEKELSVYREDSEKKGETIQDNTIPETPPMYGNVSLGSYQITQFEPFNAMVIPIIPPTQE